MHLSKEDLLKTEKIKRLNIINSITGIKPANLIGTRSKSNETNLAIFSSVVHLGSNPALLGFVLRPDTEVRRHTYENIRETGYYTINHVPDSLTEQAHYTSAKFPKEESEYERCGFHEEYAFNFYAPFVKQSIIKVGLKYEESVPIKANNTVLVIGLIEHITIADNCIDDNGHIDLEQAKSAGISGLNSYYSFEKIAQYPYARLNDLPSFK